MMKKNILSGAFAGLVVIAIVYDLCFDLSLLLLLIITALSFGSLYKLRLRGVDRVLASLCLGLGSVAFLVWLSTFKNYNYRSVYLIVSLGMIFVRRENLFSYSRIISNFSIIVYRKYYYVLLTLLVFLGLYLIAAATPIVSFDSLTKHIAIPFKIINSSHYDYNVVESIVFGDYALLTYMLYTYLLVFGATKALAIFVCTISFLVLLTLLRIVGYFCKKQSFCFAISIIYFTTPLVFSQSTIIYVDLISIYFVFTMFLVIQYKNLISIRTNLFAIALMAGFGVFAKPTSAYYIIPAFFCLLYILIINFKKIRLHDGILIIAALCVFLLPFLPSLLIVWHKTGNPIFPFMNNIFRSDYFPAVQFKDPFNASKLGLDFHSLYSIVFDTSKNIEMTRFGAGIFPILAPVIIVTFFLSRRKLRFTLLTFMTVASYYVATRFAYNIRYFIGSLIMLIPLILYSFEILSKKFRIKIPLVLLCAVCIGAIQCLTLLNRANYNGINKAMFRPDRQFIKNANANILNTIPNAEKSYILSNNDLFRGIFPGHFYSLEWYNSFMLTKLRSGQISPVDLLKQFDYYLIYKFKSVNTYTDKMDPADNTISPYLSVYAETPTHVLYKIKNTFETLSEKRYDEPHTVNVKEPENFAFNVDSSAYKITLDVEKADEGAMSRFQINWIDADGNFLGTYLIPFQLDGERKKYSSGVIDEVPEKATVGILYLCSNDDKKINLYGYTLQYKNKREFLYEILKKYSSKFPSLAGFEK